MSHHRNCTVVDTMVPAIQIQTSVARFCMYQACGAARCSLLNGLSTDTGYWSCLPVYIFHCFTHIKQVISANA